MEKNRRVIQRHVRIILLLLINIIITIDKSLGQSWRKNDRIETFRTRPKQFVCPPQDVTFELVTGKVYVTSEF